MANRGITAVSIAQMLLAIVSANQRNAVLQPSHASADEAEFGRIVATFEQEFYTSVYGISYGPLTQVHVLTATEITDAEGAASYCFAPT